MSRARLRFPRGEPLEFRLEDVLDHGPPIPGFRAWLGAVFASSAGRWIIRFADEAVLGFRREDLAQVRLTESAAELTLGRDPQRVLTVREADVVSFGPEPDDVRSWLGRLAHGSGEAWIRLVDGRELRFPIGDGPHVSFIEEPDRPGRG